MFFTLITSELDPASKTMIEYFVLLLNVLDLNLVNNLLN